VVDIDEEQREAVGMVIRSDQFPDSLFAPPKRDDFMEDGINPVYDKEMRSELFGHGTLMLRLVIQLSMFLALIVMAFCLYIWPVLAPWYTSYVLLFNMLVGPVFAAGTITNERERQTLELLLTTTLSPWQILSGKLASSLRISIVLTSFLVWPLLLAWLLPPWTYWNDTLTMLTYLAIILVTALTTTTIATFCSVIFRRTPVSMMTAYLVVVLLFALPIAVKIFADVFRPGDPSTLVIRDFLFVSPFAASFSLPLVAETARETLAQPPLWAEQTALYFLGFYVLLDIVLLGFIMWLFSVRWRVAL
jgi:ABC-type transport system involved in multi-copper enzyme maturation permease subunit